MLKRIEEIRNWIAVCEAAGMGVPKEIHELDAYARLLESEIINLTMPKKART